MLRYFQISVIAQEAYVLQRVDISYPQLKGQSFEYLYQYINSYKMFYSICLLLNSTDDKNTNFCLIYKIADRLVRLFL